MRVIIAVLISLVGYQTIAQTRLDVSTSIASEELSDTTSFCDAYTLKSGFETKLGIATSIKYGVLYRTVNTTRYNSELYLGAKTGYSQNDKGLGVYFTYKVYVTKSSSFQFGLNVLNYISSERWTINSNDDLTQYYKPFNSYVETGYSLHFAKYFEAYIHANIFLTGTNLAKYPGGINDYTGAQIPPMNFAKESVEIVFTLIVNTPILFKKKRIR